MMSMSITSEITQYHFSSFTMGGHVIFVLPFALAVGLTLLTLAPPTTAFPSTAALESAFSADQFTISQRETYGPYRGFRGTSQVTTLLRTGKGKVSQPHTHPTSPHPHRHTERLT